MFRSNTGADDDAAQEVRELKRSVSQSTCRYDRDGNDIHCPKHPGRGFVRVTYSVLGLTAEAWDDDEAKADELARADLKVKLEQRSKELHLEGLKFFEAAAKL